MQVAEAQLFCGKNLKTQDVLHAVEAWEEGSPQCSGMLYSLQSYYCSKLHSKVFIYFHCCITYYGSS